VLIGKLRATLGQQYIAGEDVSAGLNKVHRYIGVCPQFDVVWNDLSVADHLAFQARQRGVPANMVSVWTPPFSAALSKHCIVCSLMHLLWVLFLLCIMFCC
jgi:ABC-type sugar transport system ATPase subunit